MAEEVKPTCGCVEQRAYGTYYLDPRACRYPEVVAERDALRDERDALKYRLQTWDDAHGERLAAAERERDRLRTALVELYTYPGVRELLAPRESLGSIQALVEVALESGESAEAKLQRLREWVEEQLAHLTEHGEILTPVGEAWRDAYRDVKRKLEE